MNQLIEKITDRFDDNENNLELQPYIGALTTAVKSWLKNRCALVWCLLTFKRRIYGVYFIPSLSMSLVPLDFPFHAVL